MRKRIGIACISVVAAVGVYVLSQPRNGSVEYHKKEIARLSDLSDSGRQVFWRRFLRRLTGTDDIANPNYEKLEKRINWHVNKLRELGFWEERDYVFTNSVLTEELVRTGAAELIQTPSVAGTRFYFYMWHAKTNGYESNVFTVRVPKTDIARWDELVRRTDVRQSGK